jgi:hypothetical protein
MKRLLFVTIVLAACGGSEKPADKTMPMGGEGEGHDGHDMGKEHPKLTPELDAFHEVLAPRWHADKGDARINDTCTAAPDFLTKAKAIEAGPVPPKADAKEWASAAHMLVASVEGLSQTCAGDRASFDAAFTSVHDAFHALMGYSMGEHAEHMETMEGHH